MFFKELTWIKLKLIHHALVSLIKLLKDYCFSVGFPKILFLNIAHALNSPGPRTHDLSRKTAERLRQQFLLDTSIAQTHLDFIYIIAGMIEYFFI